MGGDLKIAAEILETENQSLVVVRDGRKLFSSSLPGVKSLLDALDSDVLPGSAVADKVIGRAAAMIAALGEVKAVHTPLMSQGAAEVFSSAGILYSAEKIVPCIKNRQGTGPCPIEAATEFTVVPEKGVAAIRQLLQELQGANKTQQAEKVIH
ncbi:MAG: DUF1893 domain-containing protein [Firmicutes bacterium]|nr:DUF1893 domain-containing protein [Bacillota bacterium]